MRIVCEGQVHGIVGTWELKEDSGRYELRLDTSGAVSEAEVENAMQAVHDAIQRKALWDAQGEPVHLSTCFQPNEILHAVQLQLCDKTCAKLRIVVISEPSAGLGDDPIAGRIDP